MIQLFHQDNKRYEWIKEQLDLKDYKLKDVVEYKRETRYVKYLNEVNELNEIKRTQKMMQLKNEFDKQIDAFYNEKQQILLEIQNEIKKLGFKDIKFV